MTDDKDIATCSKVGILSGLQESIVDDITAIYAPAPRVKTSDFSCKTRSHRSYKRKILYKTSIRRTVSLFTGQ